LWKDAAFAKQAAESMKITAPDLKELGIIDEIIPEIKGGAHKDVKKQAEEIDAILKKALKELLMLSEEELMEDRYNRFRTIGEYSFINEYIGVQ
ncbi:MAG: acetyl-CoA carboxylase subunit alpha, partial [Neobacillus sp.]|nr:acetyl-CoA carboxylase subunit alpha [Neobacillus sp.]